MLSSFDETLNDYGESMKLYSHRENTTSFENMFKKDFKNLKYEFEKVGNPFFEEPKYYKPEWTFTCSKLTIETLEQGVKYVQS